jgi:hypothetical protein
LNDALTQIFSKIIKGGFEFWEEVVSRKLIFFFTTRLSGRRDRYVFWAVFHPKT